MTRLLADMVAVIVANHARDHAWLYVVLASDESRALPGVVFSSDGGLLLKSPRV
jgi:hypothetical protein